MGTLYIDHQGMRLEAQGGALVLRGTEAERPRSVPLVLLERVVVHGEAEISTGALGRMAEAGVGCLILSGRQSWRTACLLGRPHRDVRIRLAQYQMTLDSAAAAAWARLWVRGKLRAQQRLLRAGQRARPEHRTLLTAALATLDVIEGRLQAPLPLATLRGLEGAAAAAYFPALARLFARALGFEGRNRRPPRDPVNAVLSLGYTLLHFEAVRTAQAAGLDPLLGCLHEPAYGRESLACDLIEPLRPRLDGWAWGLFRSRQLRQEHFAYDKGACVLHKAGRRHFYEAWEDAARVLRVPLRGYCRLLVSKLRSAVLPLEPAPPDWEEFELKPGDGETEKEESNVAAIPDRL